jgi:hypothetical protein
MSLDPLIPYSFLPVPVHTLFPFCHLLQDEETEGPHRPRTCQLPESWEINFFHVLFVCLSCLIYKMWMTIALLWTVTDLFCKHAGIASHIPHVLTLWFCHEYIIPSLWSWQELYDCLNKWGMIEVELHDFKARSYKAIKLIIYA